MDNVRFINLDGEYYTSSHALLNCDNRAFLYGDALFETMISIHDHVPFMDYHIERLTKSMELIKMRPPLQLNAQMMAAEVGRLLRKNKYFNGVRVRLTVFRKAGGLYTPETNEVSYMMDSSPLSFDKFSMNKTGYQIDVFKDHLKPIHAFSSLKSTNALLFIMAGIFRKEHNLDECIILNQKGHVCESLSSNIFLVKNQKIYTPSLESGCLPGVMRRVVLEIAEKKRIPVDEVQGLTIDHVREADECFITNAVNGIRWVSGFKNERYFNKMSAFLVNELNKLIA